MVIHGCVECLKKQREIDRLTEALQRLQQTLRYQDRQATEGFFGSATLSGKRPVKTNTPPPPAPKPKGARPGYPGAGRHAFGARQAERVIDIPPLGGDRCPECDALLEDKGTDSRAVIESHPVKAERVLYRLPKPYCPRCRRTFQPRAPVVLPKGLYGNQRLATATTRHDLHGIALGKVCEQTGLGSGSMVEIFHRVARLCAGIPEQLIRNTARHPSHMPMKPAGGRMGNMAMPGCSRPPDSACFCSVRPGRPACPSRSSASLGCPAVSSWSAMVATTRSPAPSSTALATCCARSKTWHRSSPTRPRSIGSALIAVYPLLPLRRITPPGRGNRLGN